MLLRLVRPVKRSGSSIPQFVQRIPADVRARAIGRTLAIPLGCETVFVTIRPQMDAVRFSLRTRDPSEVKVRQARAAAFLETTWAAVSLGSRVSGDWRKSMALATFFTPGRQQGSEMPGTAA